MKKKMDSDNKNTEKENKAENVNNDKEEKVKKVEKVDNETNELKKGFFKKVWYSIYKIEKYSELSAEGFKIAIKYFAILILVIAVMASLASVYKTTLKVNNISKYINDKAPELSYKDGTLSVDSQDVITDEDNDFGKIIIDTNTDDEQQINQYINDVNEDENSVIILKNKMILKETGLSSSVNYEYKDLFGELGITEFNKQDLVNYLTGNNMIKIYTNLFLTLFVYAFAIYFINTLFYVIIIAIIGYLATMILRLKIRFVAVLNIGIYAITLPTILNMIYIIINTLFNYQINYFEVMYILVASIYVIAAIFILKMEFDKKQGEVQKIVEVEKEVKEEAEKQEEKEENKDTEKNKDTSKDKKEDKKEETEDGGEPEGSNA